MSSTAKSQSKQIGQTFEEIERLAKKEGVVRLGSGLRPKEVPIVLGAFMKKYPDIKIETTRTSGSRWAERVMNEALGGLYELDVYDVPGGLQEQFIKAGIVVPVEWRRLFPDVADVQLSPEGHFVAVGFNLRIIAYNKTLVPPERVPTSWSDCLDPHWKGKFLVDTRPRFLSGLYKAWGEDRILKFAAQLKKNDPVFISGQTAAAAQLGAGEYPMFCGAHYVSAHRVIRRDPNTNLALVMPKEVPVSLAQMLSLMKGARSPNAAILLAGWLASPKGGQIGYEKIGRGSPFIEGTEKANLIKKSGAKIVYEGWDRSAYEPVMIEKITRSWGFPVAK
jgi:ABC-type Fe3+ transport system substrate-binding protein